MRSFCLTYNSVFRIFNAPKSEFLSFIAGIAGLTDAGGFMKVLDVGCGNCKLKGAIGIDISPAADIRHDLNKFPYPIKPNSFDKI